MNIISAEIKTFLNENQSLNILKIITFLEGYETLQDNVIVEEHTATDFYKICFSCNFHKRCSFSLWIERSSGQVLFFNIGEHKLEATVFHYTDVSSPEDTEQVLSGIKTFLESVIEEKKQYCNSSLKKVSYRLIHKNHKRLVYTKLVESYLFCFRKTLTYDKYEPWRSGIPY